MEPVLQSFLAGFPVLLLHFSVTLAMLGTGVTIYQWITPYHELDLIRAGNNAAAISLSGAIVGLALPLAVCMASSVSVWDIIIWGVVTLVIQLLAYRLGDAVLRGLPARIEAGEIGAAILIAAIKFAVAMINAAAVAG
jgi:putative membrane protein